MAHIEISPHCVNRFMERSGCKKASKAIKTIRRMLGRGEPIRPRTPVIKLLNNGCRPASYLFSDGWVLVIDGDVVKTIYHFERQKWVRENLTPTP